MIREIALEPDLITGFDRLRLLTDNFGVHLGRVLSRYPDNWQQRVLDHLKDLGVKDVERKLIVEWMTTERFRRSLIQRENALYDNTLAWLPNALDEHARKRFGAIVAGDNPTRNPDVLLPDDLNSDCEKWRIISCRVIRRTAADIAAAALPLLTMSHHIMFIDPYFRPNNPRFRRPLAAMLSPLRATRIPEIEYHVNNRDLYPKRFFGDCQRFLPGLLPRGMSLRVVIWPAERMHNRYILTDLGGLQFGHGLDEDAHRTEEDEVSLLDRSAWMSRREQFRMTAGNKPIDSQVFHA